MHTEVLEAHRLVWVAESDHLLSDAEPKIRDIDYAAWTCRVLGAAVHMGFNNWLHDAFTEPSEETVSGLMQELIKVLNQPTQVEPEKNLEPAKESD